MKILLLMFVLPFVLIGNVIGGLAAFIQVAVVNGYIFVMELIEKASEK